MSIHCTRIGHFCEHCSNTSSLANSHSHSHFLTCVSSLGCFGQANTCSCWLSVCAHRLFAFGRTLNRIGARTRLGPPPTNHHFVAALMTRLGFASANSLWSYPFKWMHQKNTKCWEACHTGKRKSCWRACSQNVLASQMDVGRSGSFPITQSAIKIMHECICFISALVFFFVLSNQI